MTHLLLMTAFVLIMAIWQWSISKKIAGTNIQICFGKSTKKDNGIVMITVLLVMMCLAALRSSEVGNDTKEYIRIFNMVISDPDYINVTRFEKGYLYLNKFIGLFTHNPQWVLIVTSSIYYLIFIWFFKKHSKDYAFTLVLFFFLMYGATLTMIRQQLAIAFVFVAFDRIMNKHCIRAMIWILVAFLFHSSAILLLILPILPHIKFNKWLAFIIILLCSLCAFTDLLYKVCIVLAPSYAHYFDSAYVGSGWLAVSFNLFCNLIFFVIIWFVLNRDKQSVIVEESTLTAENEKNLQLWIAFIAFAGMILGYKINLVDRIVLYFTVFAVLFLPNALTKTNSKYKMLIVFGITLMLAMYLIIVLKYRPNWNRIYPYTFFWQD